MKHSSILAVCILLCASSAGAALPSTAGIVEVRDVRNPSSATPSLGFIADGQGHVLSPTPEGAFTLLVRLSDGTEYRADLIHLDVRSGIGLLKIKVAVPSDALVPYVWVAEAIESGRMVHGVTKDSTSGSLAFVAGSVSRIVAPDVPTEPEVILHNVLVGKQHNGSPLLNNCGEIGGIIVNFPNLDASSVSSEVDKGQKEGYELAISSEWLVRVFGQHGFEPETSTQPCLPGSVRLQRVEDKAKQSEMERREAEERAQAADAAREKAEEESQKEVAAATQAREEAEKKASVEQEAREKAEAEAEDREKQITLWAWVAGASLVLLLLLIRLAYLRSANRASKATDAARQKEKEARSELAGHKEQEEKIKGLPDVVLSGEDADGERFVVRIPKHSLVEGAVVGRSPGQSAFILNHGEVSRRHLRLFVQEEAVKVEDLESTNGTEVDGIRLTPGDGAEIHEGTRLRLGNLSLVVRLE